MRISPFNTPTHVSTEGSLVCVSERSGRISLFDEESGALVEHSRALERRVDLLYREAPLPAHEERGLLAAVSEPRNAAVGASASSPHAFYALYATVRERGGGVMLCVSRVCGSRVETVLAVERSSVRGGALAYGPLELGSRLLYVAVGEEEGKHNGFVTCLDLERHARGEVARKLAGQMRVMTRELGRVTALVVRDTVHVESDGEWVECVRDAREWPVSCEASSKPAPHAPYEWRIHSASRGVVERVRVSECAL